MLPKLIEFIYDYCRTESFNTLYELVSRSNGKAYVAEAIDSTFVSSVRHHVDKLEHNIIAYMGSPNSLARAQVPHRYVYTNDELGFNYCLPTRNSASSDGQIEQIEAFVEEKQCFAASYADNLASGLHIVTEPEGGRSNYWLTAVICNGQVQRGEWFEGASDKGVMTRPIWKSMSRLPMYAHAPAVDICNAESLEQRVAHLPSGLLPSDRGKDA